MSHGDEIGGPEPFPDLDATGALRAAFRPRAASGSDRGSLEARVDPPGGQGYELQGEIARGGMGVIVKAFDRGLTREVALKVLRDELAHEPRCVQRFLEEARVTARLDHPGIVPVHEAGRDPAGRAYFAMRLVRGRDLRRIMELANANAEGWSRTRALSVFLRVCEAMAYAHERGVLHRDLKPSNVMVGEFGEVYVMDWGLARTLGQADAHDLRLREPGEPGEPHDAGEPASGESPLVTLDGEVLGTPCYMSPEQAQGRVAELEARSDVYSVGAMLYHLLASAMPYVPAGTSVDSRTVLLRLAQGPPRPLHELRRDLPAELIAICERAMARDPAQRYRSMLAMAEDLRAFLENRVVQAHRTGALVELKKWVERNTALAAASAVAVLALLCGLVASLVLRAQSDRNARLAQDNATVAQKREEDVFRLSALQELDDLGADADRLWPARQELIPAYTDWLERAQALVDQLPGYEAKLAELRARAVPWTAEQEGERRKHHPRLGELEKTRRELAYRKRMQTVLDSAEVVKDPTPADAGVELAALPGTAAALDGLARPLIDPRRTDHGDEAKGLLLARRALERAGPLAPPERASIRDTLAWALFASGRFDEAMAEEQRALQEGAEAGAERAREFHAKLAALQAAIEERISPESLESEEQHVAELEARVAALEAEIAQRPELAFADTQDRWWYNQLEKLVDGAKAFSDPETGLCSGGVAPGHGWGVRKRLEFAGTIVERSVGGLEAVTRWSRALASIRDESECPLYDGLALEPQLGLLPIGRDPASGAWEFADLQTGEPAERGADGELVLREETGLVFVLLPGGTFRMGAQRKDRNGPNFDPRALDNEGPVLEVTLAPFFLSKYEMTQGQWLRLTGKNPSIHKGANYLGTRSKNRRAWSELHPVEQVTWEDCNTELTRLRLALPTEAQWEYACRAGTSSVFSSGDAQESLQGVANLADSYGKANGFDAWALWEPWLDDGETMHGEVGSYRANAFGLHDMHGNVFEWCRDRYVVYGKRTRPGNGESQGTGPYLVLRGGSFSTTAVFARSAYRFVGVHDYANDNLGLRPARSLAP